MTATETPTTETPSGKPPVRQPRGVVPVAAIITLAALTLILWMLSTSSRLETSPINGTSAVASAPAPALRQASAGWNSRSVNAPAAYLMFCENSPALCGAPLPLVGYLQFCWNSPTLCVLPEPN